MKQSTSSEDDSC